MGVHSGWGEVESDQSSLSPLHTLSLNPELRVALRYVRVFMYLKDKGTVQWFFTVHCLCCRSANLFCFTHKCLRIYCQRFFDPFFRLLLCVAEASACLC